MDVARTEVRMEVRTVEDLACDRCGGALALDGVEPGQTELVYGTLTCTKCRKTTRVLGGVPRFVDTIGDLDATAKSYGFQWSGFWQGLFDRGDVFGLHLEETASYFLRSLGFEAGDVAGKTVLDAGTGSGRVPLSIHALVKRVYAVDMHSGIDAIANRLSGLRSVRVVQANLLTLPFPDGFFDIAWSSGVIMLAPDAGQAFAAVARKVRPGGRMFVSVYGKDINHYRMFRHFLPWAHRLPTPLVYALSAIIAVPLFVGFNVMLWYVRTFRQGPPPHRVAMFTVEDSSHKSYKSIVLNLFDQLHPQSQTEHSVDEVLGWYSANGFHNMVVTEHIGMVAVRGDKRL